MTKETRTITLRAAEKVETRVETYQGREWTVVPVVALVETVVHALNSKYAEFVPVETLTKTPLAWNGRPVFIGHPMKGNSPVPGNTPETLEALAVGQIFNAGTKDGKLVMEAWLDNERVEEVPELKDLLDRIAAGDPIEISVGAFVETNDVEGEYNGRKYKGEWIDLAPEHLALLPEGDIGACSIEQGCGVRAAQAKGENVMSEPRKGLLARVLGTMRSLLKPEDMSDNDVRRKLYDALRDAGVRDAYVEAVYDDDFVYCVYGYDNYSYMRRGYSLSDEGVVTLGQESSEVEPVLSYEPVATAEMKAAAAKTTAATAAPCSCQHPAATDVTTATSSKESNMKREDILKKLEGATDEQLAAVGQVFEPAAPAAPAATEAAAPAPAATPAPTVAAAAPTFNELLAAADADTRASIESGIKVAKERKAVTIKTLKDTGRCTFGDDALAAMSQEQLDNLVSLAGVSTPVQSATDFSGRGLARSPEASQKDAPAAPDLAASIRAARGQQAKA